MADKKLEIIPTEEPLPVQIIEQAIVDIAEGMKKLNSTRLTRKALIVLIQSQSGISRQTINIVLNNLTDLENDWLKPRT